MSNSTAQPVSYTHLDVYKRQMWREGLLMTLLTILLRVPYFLLLISTFNPSLFGNLPLGWLPTVSDICVIASWAVNVVMGLFAISWYRRESKKSIDKIYADYPEGEARTDALVQHGGTNLWAALLYFAVILLLYALVINLAGPGLVPVSYTHLDVYKRQRLRRRRSWRPCARAFAARGRADACLLYTSIFSCFSSGT